MSNQNKNDCFSNLKGNDLQELMLEIKRTYIPFRQQLGILSDATFGIEIEFEKASYRSVELALEDMDNWLLKEDGTVMDYRIGIALGGEINSPVLTDKEEIWSQVKAVCHILKKYGALTEERAGGHIHVGSPILGSNFDAWVHFLKVWAVYEKVIYRFSFGERIHGRGLLGKYASPISKKIYQNVKYHSDSLSNLLGDYTRYSGVNFGNVNRFSPEEYGCKNTIEFRCSNSSVEEIIWQNNICFFVKLLEACASSRFDWDFIDYQFQNGSENIDYDLYTEIYLKSSLELVDAVFDNNIDKLYFLKQYLKDYQQVSFGMDSSKVKRLIH